MPFEARTNGTKVYERFVGLKTMIITPPRPGR